MMTAMIKTPEPHSDSEDSVLLNLHLQLLIHNLYPQYPNFLPTNQKIKSKLLGLKKILTDGSSPTKPLSTYNTSPSYPISITPPVIENSSPPPPNNNLLINPHSNLSPRNSQLPPISSPPSFHNSPPQFL